MITTTMGHTFRTDTLLQMVFDFGFLAVFVIIGLLWVKNGLPIDPLTIVIYAVILSLVMLAINAWLGFYQRIHDRTIQDTRARAVLSLHLSIPVAYLIYVLLPIAEGNRTMFEITGMAGLFGLLSYRVMASHRRARPGDDAAVDLRRRQGSGSGGGFAERGGSDRARSRLLSGQ